MIKIAYLKPLLKSLQQQLYMSHLHQMRERMLKEFCLRKVSKTILESFKVLLNNNTSKIENREKLLNLGATKTEIEKHFTVIV